MSNGPKMPNIPMTHPISTMRQKVDQKKFDTNFDRIFRKKDNRKKESK